MLKCAVSVRPALSTSLKPWRRMLASAPTAASSEEKAEGAASEGVKEADEPLWKDPYKHALPPQRRSQIDDFKESKVDWSYVERLLPRRVVPEMPRNCGVLPSGWRPPREPAPDLPYYIRRSAKHMPRIFLETRRDELNVKTMEFEYEEVVTLKGVCGDVFACAADMKKFLEGKVGHPVATRVDEIKGDIKTKGAHRKFVEEFVFESGF